eukprot:TRINITY_DN2591_c0_g1_i3.p1 TRINITY_DN2591_c0_g1~~TRINITY_DN2591_c0_g1_i3.p1  ORF type:complete len:196 (+),score=26.84 TRINITY_DN2591_c0_g1_i3:48-635(+)
MEASLITLIVFIAVGSLRMVEATTQTQTQTQIQTPLSKIAATITATQTLRNCLTRGCPRGHTCQSNGKCVRLNVQLSEAAAVPESSDCPMGCPSGHHCRNGMCVADVVTEGCQITGCPADHYCVRDGEFKGKCVSAMSPPAMVPPRLNGMNTDSEILTIWVSCSPLVIGILIMVAVISFKITRLPKLPKEDFEAL